MPFNQSALSVSAQYTETRSIAISFESRQGLRNGAASGRQEIPFLSQPNAKAAEAGGATGKDSSAIDRLDLSPQAKALLRQSEDAGDLIEKLRSFLDQLKGREGGRDLASGQADQPDDPDQGAQGQTTALQDFQAGRFTILAEVSVSFSLEISVASSRLSGRSGDNLIFAPKGGTVDAGSGDDTIGAEDEAEIRAGSGDDVINAGAGSTLYAGSGDDTMRVGAGSTIRAGSGDDTIHSADDSSIHAGSGDDRVVAGQNTRVSAGSGDDVVTVGTGSTVDGGSGDDRVMAGQNASVSGGSGDDAITVGAGSTVDGGTGNDTIFLTGPGTVSYNAGQGNDTITFTEGGTLAFGDNVKPEKVSISYEDGKALVQVGDDVLSVAYDPASPVTLTFADGSSQTLAGGEPADAGDGNADVGADGLPASDNSGTGTAADTPAGAEADKAVGAASNPATAQEPAVTSRGYVFQLVQSYHSLSVSSSRG